MELTNEFTVGVPVERAWDVLTDVERIAPCMPGAQLQEVEGDEYRGVVKVKVGPITAQYKGAARFLERDEAGRRVVLRAEGRETRGQGNAAATITATMVPAGDGTQVTVATDLTVTGRVAQFGRGVLADVSAKLLGQFVSCLETEVLGDAGEATPAAAAAPVETTPAPAPPADPATVPPGTAPAGESTAAGDGQGDRVLVSTATGPVDAGPATPPAGTAGAPIEPAATGPGVRRVDHPEVEPVDLVGVAGGSVARRVLPAVGVLAVIVWLFRFRRGRRSE